MTRTGGNEEPIIKISCLNMTSSLIISQFIINNQKIWVIIDCGATASFILAQSRLITGLETTIINTTNRVQIADNKTMPLNQIIELKTQIGDYSEPEHSCRYYIMPGEENSLGYQAIVGIDLMKKFIISISQEGGIMVAKVENKVIGKVKLLSLSFIAQVILPDSQESLNKLISHYS